MVALVRSSAQITRTPEEYLDFKARERRFTLGLLLEELAEARELRPEWYVWATEGQPTLTREAYARLRGGGELPPAPTPRTASRSSETPVQAELEL